MQQMNKKKNTFLPINFASPDYTERFSGKGKYPCAMSRNLTNMNPTVSIKLLFAP